ncbi:MAG TPA: ATP phosphoribosyltransferase regulatory subunit [Syntrophomonadaceae bacterium]|nr:ATP phosphoribosyltransferase regulatory subunit [Syntrophomonadaceae bacterium]
MHKRQIPKGLRDLMPDEVKVRRHMERNIASLFQSYGYREIVTPTFEFLDVIESGTGGSIRKDLFLFMDREGEVLSLRPEMTVSIARLAATHLQEGFLPQRLYYNANVFRHVQPHLAQYREFWQMGIELLGASGVWADAEVITIAIKSLRCLGLNNFKISLNQIGIFNSLLADSGLQAADQAAIRRLVEEKDLVELSRVLESLAIDEELKDSIARLPVLHGGLEILDRIPYIEKNRQASEAVAELQKVHEALRISGVIDSIVVDMGVLRGLDYYTGIVFEGYSPDLGYGLLGGGRYDKLLGQFGFDQPATGFAMGLDRLALVLKTQEKERPRYLIGGRNLSHMIAEADRLREEGWIVEVDIEGRDRALLEDKLKNQPDYCLLYLGE